MRRGTRADYGPTMAALIRLQERAQGRGQMAHASVPAAAYSVELAIAEGRLRFVDGYAIMFDVGREWYSFDLYLIEQIIIKVYDTDAPVEVAIDALDIIAAEYGCKAIAAGDTQVGYMTPKYINKGYAILGTQLFKGVPDGIRPKSDGGAGSD
jgi:hypothetical protein